VRLQPPPVSASTCARSRNHHRLHQQRPWASHTPRRFHAQHTANLLQPQPLQPHRTRPPRQVETCESRPRSITMMMASTWRRAAVAASSTSSTPNSGRHICWAPALSQTKLAAERFKWTSVADPCFYHPTSPLAHTLVDRAPIEKRCSFELDSDEQEAPSASNRRRLSKDPLYTHPSAMRNNRCSSGTCPGATMTKLDLVRGGSEAAAAAGGAEAQFPRQPTPRPTDAQAAWAAAFTENSISAERQRATLLRIGEARPSVLSPVASSGRQRSWSPVSLSSRCTGVGAYTMQSAVRPTVRQRSGSCP
jgi:hypothetical protein